MKLYYDNLFSFMPNAKIVDGKPVVDTRLDAARKAMIMLAQFQAIHNVSALYEAVNQISICGEIDLLSLLFSLGDVEVPTAKVDDLLDMVAQKLFIWATNYNPDSEDTLEFNYKEFASILLSIAHTIFVLTEQKRIDNTQMSMEQPKPEDTTEKA